MPNGARRWYQDHWRPLTGQRNILSLGTNLDTGLTDVRTKRDEARKLFARAVDPGDERKTAKTGALRPDVLGSPDGSETPPRRTCNRFPPVCISDSNPLLTGT